MIKPKAIFVLSVILFICSVTGAREACFAQAPTASQIERTQKDLEKEKALRETIEKGQKVFIKKIIVKGATLLSEEQIKETILPFQKHWLTKEDIQRLIDSLKQLYQQQTQQVPTVSYEIKSRNLVINIEGPKNSLPK